MFISKRTGISSLKPINQKQEESVFLKKHLQKEIEDKFQCWKNNFIRTSIY